MTNKKEYIKAVHYRLRLDICDLPYYRNTIRFDERLWNHHLDYAATAGMNMALIDVCEGVKLKSHPELAVIDARSADWMNAEVRKRNAQGLEMIPKFNFSLGHDGWLGDYSYMIGTPEYYKVCEDVLAEIYDIFEKPRFIQIGMDEECNNDRNDVVQMRFGDFYWKDLAFYAKAVERIGSRPWMWSDKGWPDHKTFLERCPKSIVQSNWYYDDYGFGFDIEEVKRQSAWQASKILFMNEMDAAGFDQIPAGSVYNYDARVKKGLHFNDSMVDLIKYCRKTFDSKHLLGFMMTGWQEYNDPDVEKLNDHAVDLVIRGCNATI